MDLGVWMSSGVLAHKQGDAPERVPCLNAVVKLPKSGGLKVDILSMIVVPDPL